MKTPSRLNRWLVTASRYVHHDRWIRVRADDCVTDQGEKISPYYVLEYPDWVHIVALTQDEKVLLVTQYRHGAASFSLEIPAGSLEPDDAGPLAAAARELAEETGYVAEEYRLVASLSPNPATHANRVHIILALNARLLAERMNDPSELIEVSLVHYRDLILAISDSEVIQALQVSSVFLGLQAAGLIKFTPKSRADPTGELQV